MVNVSEFLNALKEQAVKNDDFISEDEAHIIRHLERMDIKTDRLNIFAEILKAVYQDGKLTEDESDIVAFAKDFLKITERERAKVLANINVL